MPLTAGNFDMASAPDFSQQMREMNKPTEAENAQHKIGTLAQADYMRDIIGSEKNPGAAREFGSWIESIGDPSRIEFQKGQAVGSTQLGFRGADLLRSAAVARSGGSGIADSTLRSGYSALGSALSGSTAGTGTAATSELNRSRLGMAKIGQGMSDAVISGYNNLGSQQSQQRQTAMEAAIEGGKRQLESTIGYMKTGAQVLGGLTSAASGATKKDDKGNVSFDMGQFGKNLGSGFSGGTTGLYGAMRG